MLLLAERPKHIVGFRPLVSESRCARATRSLRLGSPITHSEGAQRSHGLRWARFHTRRPRLRVLVGAFAGIVLTPAYEASREVGAVAHCIHALTLLCLASLAFALVLSSLLVLSFSFALALAGALALEGIDVCTLLLWAPEAWDLVLVGWDVFLVLNPFDSSRLLLCTLVRRPSPVS